MKTCDDINSLAWNADEKLCGKVAGQAIADAWNADVAGFERQVAFYVLNTQRQAEKALTQARRLRKLRNELGEAKALCGIYFHQREMHGEEIRRLMDLIERIAREAK